MYQLDGQNEITPGLQIIQALQDQLNFLGMIINAVNKVLGITGTSFSQYLIDLK